MGIALTSDVNIIFDNKLKYSFNDKDIRIFGGRRLGKKWGSLKGFFLIPSQCHPSVTSTDTPFITSVLSLVCFGNVIISKYN